MSTKRIDGQLFERLLKNAYAYLCSRESEINALNVFPVADGDTGTNMRLTLENGIRSAQSNKELHEYLRTLNTGLLMGARGNSGVILSQLFNGMYQHLDRCDAANARDMANAFISAYKTAYKAVVCPTEGTILTVSREGIENVRDHMDRSTTIEAIFAMYIGEMKKSLSHTPEMLSVLKEANVIDSGALGYIVIMEGMYKYLNGEILQAAEVSQAALESAATSLTDERLFNEDSTFEQGYCMEFILQLLRDSQYDQYFRLPRFIDKLKRLGNSIVVHQEEKRVKVHIHTLKPGIVIGMCQEFGEFVTFKLENMQIQHNEQMERKQVLRRAQTVAEQKQLAVVAVSCGDGMMDVFSELGCDVVIDGGETMSVSTERFLSAFEGLNADHIAVLPNNKNILLAAKQAAELWGKGNVTIVPTVNMAEGYYAKAMDLSDEEELNTRLAEMEQNGKNTHSVALARASKPYSNGVVSCGVGDWIALIGDTIVAVNSDPVWAFLEGLSKVDEIDDKESCVVFTGYGCDDEMAERFQMLAAERFPDLEITFICGGQQLYPMLAGMI